MWTQRDPLKLLESIYKFNIHEVKKMVCGRKYSAVMLNNGQIGVCANLSEDMNFKKDDLNHVDFNNVEHRIVMTAYFNARLNYLNKDLDSDDIFDAVNFHMYENVVMVGLFRPILDKMLKKKIKVTVFDESQTDPRLKLMSEMKFYLQNAEAVILTGTSIYNKTFNRVLSSTSSFCDVFILGPSSIMSPEILEYKNIKKIFGAIFPLYEEKVLEIIENGGGTQEFLKLGKKVVLSQPDK